VELLSDRGHGAGIGVELRSVVIECTYPLGRLRSLHLASLALRHIARGGGASYRFDVGRRKRFRAGGDRVSLMRAVSRETMLLNGRCSARISAPFAV
jgi:hypothetical protein